VEVVVVEVVVVVGWAVVDVVEVVVDGSCVVDVEVPGSSVVCVVPVPRVVDPGNVVVGAGEVAA
jgi:hypothetical protein